MDVVRPRARRVPALPIAVLAVLGFAGIWWLVSARKWFTGPRRQGSIDELIELEAQQGGS